MLCFFFFCKKKTAYEIEYGLVGSEMCIRDRGDGAHTTAGKAPGADIAVHIAHVVVEQDIGLSLIHI